MPIEPITPDDVIIRKQSIIPDVVIDCFNELIAKNYSGGYSTLKQIDVVNLIFQKMTGPEGSSFDKQIIYDEHWLDVDSIYREKGWIVEYDKPGFNESYDATFTFKRRKKL